METRVIRMEEWSKQSEARTARIEIKLDTILVGIARLPTRTDVITYFLVMLTLLLTFGGLLIGGLGWLETRGARIAPTASAPQPIVIQLPAQAVSAPTPARAPLPHRGAAL